MYPEAFLERMKQLLGEEYPDFLNSLKDTPHRGLRLNPLKVKEEDFLSQAPFSLTPVPWAEHGFYYSKQDTPGKHPYHEAGVYYIQEPSAMSVVPLLHASPGERILDLCAAPGGKSTQIGCALKGLGLFVTNEIHPARAKSLSSNIERLGITNCLVCNEAPKRLAAVFPEFFDKILVDAPCSGEGMFRKNPEAISEWSVDNVMLCAARQQEVLAEAVKMLKPGGRLVYSTCTFAPEENENALECFISKHPDIILLETKRLFPHKQKGEGHFAGVLEKKGALRQAIPDESPSTEGAPVKFFFTENSDRKDNSHKKKEKKTSGGSGLLRNAPSEFTDFLTEALTPSGQAYIKQLQKQGAGFLFFGEQLYLLPSGLPPLNGIKILRPGLHLGAIRKNRFLPSHGLALALSKEHVKAFAVLSCDSPEIKAYLEGQALNLSPGSFPDLTVKKGWCLVLADDYSLGWGKLSGGLLKNHYPKGLRKQI